MRRLLHNRNYVWGVVAQFFYMGAQIATWSFVIRYAMHALHFDRIVAALGDGATSAQITDALRHVEPVAGGFYSLAESMGLDALLPRTAEQAGATYYILSLILFVCARFVCTFLMKYIRPRNLLAGVGVIAIACCLGAVYGTGAWGVYALMGISGCMSLMFPTIYGIGIRGLGEDTKLGGSGMVMAIAGAAVLTQIQGIVSDQAGSIALAYWVPAVAFSVVVFYALVICRKYDPERTENYVVGVDFGTDSCRALLVDAASGDVAAVSVASYPRWKQGLYCDPLSDRYRQHPLDYVESFESAMRDLLDRVGADEFRKVRAISFDTTGSTPVLTDRAGVPLALCPGFADDPDAMFVCGKTIRPRTKRSRSTRWPIGGTSISRPIPEEPIRRSGPGRRFCMCCGAIPG